MRAAFCLALLIAAGPSSAVAQAQPSRSACHSAYEAIRLRQPSYGRLRSLTMCGRDGAAALAQGIRESRSATDVVWLDALTGVARHLVDRSVVEASMDVVQDPGASTEARVYGIRTLLYALRNDRRLQFGDLQAAGVDQLPRSCTGEIFVTTQTVSRPVPASLKRQIIDLAHRLRLDESAPPDVRAAALCLYTVRDRH